MEFAQTHATDIPGDPDGAGDMVLFTVARSF